MKTVDLNEVSRKLMESIAAADAENAVIQIYDKGYIMTLRIEKADIEEE